MERRSHRARVVVSRWQASPAYLVDAVDLGGRRLVLHAEIGSAISVNLEFRQTALNVSPVGAMVVVYGEKRAGGARASGLRRVPLGRAFVTPRTGNPTTPALLITGHPYEAYSLQVFTAHGDVRVSATTHAYGGGAPDVSVAGSAAQLPSSWVDPSNIDAIASPYLCKQQSYASMPGGSEYLTAGAGGFEKVATVSTVPCVLRYLAVTLSMQAVASRNVLVFDLAANPAYGAAAFADETPKILAAGDQWVMPLPANGLPFSNGIIVGESTAQNYTDPGAVADLRVKAWTIPA